MSKKDYVAIAAKLKYEMDVAATAPERALPERPMRMGMVRVISNHIADVMARDNPRFDRERFLAACGVKP